MHLGPNTVNDSSLTQAHDGGSSLKKAKCIPSLMTPNTKCFSIFQFVNDAQFIDDDRDAEDGNPSIHEGRRPQNDRYFILSLFSP